MFALRCFVYANLILDEIMSVLYEWLFSRFIEGQ